MALDVNSADFETQVLTESENVPVLVDFWAEWCGPCRMLGPVLDRVEGEYKGRFKLVKVNTDHNQAIAVRYKISGIPAVKLFVGGKVQAEFTGALPEQAVRRFLEQNLPDPQLKTIEQEAPFAAARKALQLDSTSPERWKIIWKGVEAGIQSGEKHEEIESMLLALEKESAYRDQAASLLLLLRKFGPDAASWQNVQSSLTGGSAGLDFLFARVKADPKDKAIREEFLALLKLCPDPQLANRYRRELAALIF